MRLALIVCAALAAGCAQPPRQPPIATSAAPYAPPVFGIDADRSARSPGAEVADAILAGRPPREAAMEAAERLTPPLQPRAMSLIFLS